MTGARSLTQSMQSQAFGWGKQFTDYLKENVPAAGQATIKTLQEKSATLGQKLRGLVSTKYTLFDWFNATLSPEQKNTLDSFKKLADAKAQGKVDQPEWDRIKKAVVADPKLKLSALTYAQSKDPKLAQELKALSGGASQKPTKSYAITLSEFYKKVKGRVKDRSTKKTEEGYASFLPHMNIFE